MPELENREKIFNLPVAEADHHGHHHCPKCQTDKGTLPAGTYTCEVENCGTKFVVKDLELKEKKE